MFKKTNCSYDNCLRASIALYYKTHRQHHIYRLVFVGNVIYHKFYLDIERPHFRWNDTYIHTYMLMMMIIIIPLYPIHAAIVLSKCARLKHNNTYITISYIDFSSQNQHCDINIKMQTRINNSVQSKNEKGMVYYNLHT